MVVGKSIAKLKDHSGAVYGLALSPDGRWLASGSEVRSNLFMELFIVYFFILLRLLAYCISTLLLAWGSFICEL
jgi:WD40 repeat protein